MTPLLTVPKKAEVKPEAKQTPAEKPSRERTATTPKRVVPSPSRPLSNIVRQASRPLNAGGGQSSSQSREDEVSKGGYDEPEENIRRGGRGR